MADKSSPLFSDLMMLMLQFLQDVEFNDTARKLEQESKAFLNLQYLETKSIAGEWEEVDSYLQAFIQPVSSDALAMRIFFEIRKIRFLELLFRKEKMKAVDLLSSEFKEWIEDPIFKELTTLITYQDIRTHHLFQNFSLKKETRQKIFHFVSSKLRQHPATKDKLVKPAIDPHRLRTLINQSLNWQVMVCGSNHKAVSSSQGHITLFKDHSCEEVTPYDSSDTKPSTSSVTVSGSTAQSGSLKRSLGDVDESDQPASKKQNIG